MTMRGLVRSEWIKLASVRSTYGAILLAAAAAIALGAFDYHQLVDDWDGMSAEKRADFDPVRFGFSGGFYVVILCAGTVGVLASGSEFGTGLIRTTLTAAPRRRRLLAAKTAVIGAATLAVGEAIAFATFFVGQSILAAKHLDVDLGTPHVLRAVATTGAFVAVMALLGLALGFVVRHTAGALALLFGLFFVAPMATAATPALHRYTLQPVFQSLSSTTASGQHDRPSTAAALAACALYSAATTAVAAWLLEHRDV
ncbi:ABC transporter permease [Uniformispora flossi]|uniref:ABC transporter permease n=1 Tax=Uniformispora flossi TaxID=3390723 RepID=UPI003C2C8ADD